MRAGLQKEGDGILLVAAPCLIKPGWITDLIGYGLFAIILTYQYTQLKKK
jgi:UPF0716 family protein affecting phage T7 exclusion